MRLTVTGLCIAIALLAFLLIAARWLDRPARAALVGSDWRLQCAGTWCYALDGEGNAYALSPVQARFLGRLGPDLPSWRR